MSGLPDMPREMQVAQLENCLVDDALKNLEGFDFPTGEDERTVQEMMMAFERYATGEIHETLEIYKFGKRQQQEVNTVRDVSLPYSAIGYYSVFETITSERIC